MLALILAIFCSASMTLALKRFRTQDGNRYGILVGNYLTCILIAVLSLPDKRLIWAGHVSSLGFGILGGVFFVAALVAMQTSVRINGATLTAAFAKLGLTVTLLVSILWFRERPGVVQLIGIVLVFAALLILHGRKDNAEQAAGKASVPLLLLTLLLSGCADSMAKVFEELGDAHENVLYFFWVFLIAGILAAILALAEYLRTKKKIRLKELAAGIVVGVPNYYSSYLLLIALRKLPALVTYLVYSTGTILLVFLCSVLFFRERLSRRQLCGISLILAALVLLNL